MLNHITIMGRLTRDPELRRTGSGVAVASFTVAVDRDMAPQGQEKETDFIDCVAWRNTGEFVAKYFTKGRMIVVDGRLQIRSWTDKEGNKRRTAEVVADHCYFGDSNPQGNQSNQGNQSGYSAPAGGYNHPGNSNYGQQNNGYGTGGQYGGYGGGYAAPAAPGSDFAMLEDDDGQLPF